MRHLFVVEFFDNHVKNEKELIRPRRLLPAARATQLREPGARNFSPDVFNIAFCFCHFHLVIAHRLQPCYKN